jgi:hypothetical protein
MLDPHLVKDTVRHVDAQRLCADHARGPRVVRARTLVTDRALDHHDVAKVVAPIKRSRTSAGHERRDAEGGGLLDETDRERRTDPRVKNAHRPAFEFHLVEVVRPDLASQGVSLGQYTALDEIRQEVVEEAQDRDRSKWLGFVQKVRFDDPWLIEVVLEDRQVAALTHVERLLAPLDALSQRRRIIAPVR